MVTAVIKLSKPEDIRPFSSPELSIPSTVEEAVNHLASGLPLKGRVQIACLKEEEIMYLLPFMAAYVKTKFLLWGSNEELMASCAESLEAGDLNEGGACLVILEALWRHLRESHRMKIVT